MHEKDIDIMRRARNIDGLIRALADRTRSYARQRPKPSALSATNGRWNRWRRLKFTDADAEVRRAASLAHAQVAARLAAKRSIEGMLLKT